MNNKTRLRLDGLGLFAVSAGFSLFAWFVVGQFEGGIVPVLRPLATLVGIAGVVLGGVQALSGRHIHGGITDLIRNNSQDRHHKK